MSEPRTPLREALDAHEWQAGAWTHGCSCGWRVENTTIGRAFPAFRDHREEAVRSALRGAPADGHSQSVNEHAPDCEVKP